MNRRSGDIPFDNHFSFFSEASSELIRDGVEGRQKLIVLGDEVGEAEGRFQLG